MRHQINGTSKHVLILTLGGGGHHPIYVSWLLESELAKSTNIILASQEELFVHPAIRSRSDTFTAHQIDVAPDLLSRLKDFSPINRAYSSWEIGKLFRSTFECLSKTMDIEFVIVPFLDDCLLGLAMPNAAFGGTPWIAITMRTMFHFGEIGVIAPPQRFAAFRRLLFDRILSQRSVTAILTIDPTLMDFAKKQHRPAYKKIEYLPDPATYHRALPCKAAARRQLNIPDDARVILLYGAIDARKGVTTLLESAADSACLDQLHVLLAGRCEDTDIILKNSAYQSLLAQGRVHRVDGFVDDERERTVLAASDCMWVGYTDFYQMSGVMVLSGRHAIPVIATASGLIGYWTKKHNLGVVIDVSSRSSVVGALIQLVREPEIFARMGKNGINVFSQHNPAELQRLVTEKAMQSKR